MSTQKSQHLFLWVYVPVAYFPSQKKKNVPIWFPKLNPIAIFRIFVFCFEIESSLDSNIESKSSNNTYLNIEIYIFFFFFISSLLRELGSLC